ncbi:diaminopropionate ammonia-lyase [Actinoallomurus sp. NBC_01490]|uniref:diaminopropionate ammonia-lyase n=1 Tax=Actinoallomurus sp. NBC_01490 TaxID=2903557 RepID=UPI002E30A089|nr:diaminopropionate ammonia-lyase [Actinoallomurus sp. NBC_01490]
MPDRVSMNARWAGREVSGPAPHAADVEAFHDSLPGFEATPLVEVPRLAAGLGVGRLFVKHERERLGLPSFKIVGAAWAVHRAIAERLGTALPPRFDATLAAARSLPSGTTLTTATDGNHGRALAHMASLLGLGCRVFVPFQLSEERIAAIENEGADIVVVGGSYDDAVRRSAADARLHADRLLVSDTSWPGYETIPAAIVEGYGTIFREARAQLAEAAGEAAGFTLALVPAGVGSFAAAAVQSLAAGGCDVVAAEPLGADCVRRSLAAERPVAVPGPHESIMAGLNCGEVSHVAWPMLRRGLRAAVAVSDDEVRDAMRRLAAEGIASSESGAAGLAGLAVLLREKAFPHAGDGTVLVVGTEGVTDLDAYRAAVAG